MIVTITNTNCAIVKLTSSAQVKAIAGIKQKGTAEQLIL